MDPRLLDVLHDPGDDGGLAVADRVHVHLDRILEELVDQDRVARGGLERPVHEVPEALGVVDDLHGTAAQDVGGPHQDGIADPRGYPDRLLGVHGRAVLGLAELEASTISWNRLRSSARSIASGEVPMIGTPAFSSPRARFSGVWPPNWTITPSGFSAFHDVEHVLQGQRLEVELVRGVVVGGDRLGVGVDHDRLVALLPQGEGGVDAAVVELDPLADPVRAAAQDHDLRFVEGRVSSSVS